MDEFSKVYIKIDERSRILAVDGGYTIGNITDIENWTFIDEGSGDRYNLCQTHYLPAPVFEEHGVPQFEYVNGQVLPRSATAIEEDIANIPPAPPTLNELFDVLLGVTE